MSIRTKILEKGKIVQEQLIRTLISFDSRISALEGTDTDDTTEGTIAYRIKAIETGIGSDSTSGTISYRIKSIETDIGSESTEGTILARIKALENAQNGSEPSQSEQTPSEP